MKTVGVTVIPPTFKYLCGYNFLIHMGIKKVIRGNAYYYLEKISVSEKVIGKHSIFI